MIHLEGEPMWHNTPFPQCRSACRRRSPLHLASAGGGRRGDLLNATLPAGAQNTLSIAAEATCSRGFSHQIQQYTSQWFSWWLARCFHATSLRRPAWKRSKFAKQERFIIHRREKLLKCPFLNLLFDFYSFQTRKITENGTIHHKNNIFALSIFNPLLKESTNPGC